MRKFTTMLLAAAALALPVAAEARMSINEQQRQIDARIDQGVARGTLTRAEARELRAEFTSIEAREAAFRIGGMSASERRRLERRLDALSAKVRSEKRDRQSRG